MTSPSNSVECGLEGSEIDISEWFSNVKFKVSELRCGWGDREMCKGDRPWLNGKNVERKREGNANRGCQGL